MAIARQPRRRRQCRRRANRAAAVGF